MKVQILEASVEFFDRPFARPFALRGAAHAGEVTEARATARVRVDGREATGRGAIYLGVVWSWPESELSLPERDAAMRDLCRRGAADLPTFCGGEPEHPLELGM